LLKEKIKNCTDPLEKENLIYQMNSSISKLELNKRMDKFNETYNKSLNFRPLYNPN